VLTCIITVTWQLESNCRVRSLLWLAVYQALPNTIGIARNRIAVYIAPQSGKQNQNAR